MLSEVNWPCKLKALWTEGHAEVISEVISDFSIERDNEWRTFAVVLCHVVHARFLFYAAFAVYVTRIAISAVATMHSKSNIFNCNIGSVQVVMYIAINQGVCSFYSLIMYVCYGFKFYMNINLWIWMNVLHNQKKCAFLFYSEEKQL